MSDINNAISTTVVDAIKHHHREAMSHATQAIDHAKQAGELLLKAKATIPHGGWLSWLSENCAVSPRQAQRYMEAAQGKKVPIRELIENDTASHLPEPTDKSRGLSKAIPEPLFVPEPGRWMMATTDDGTFHVVESLEHPGYFHISKLHILKVPEPTTAEPEWDGKSMFDGTKSPVLAYAVEFFLQGFGLAEPSKAVWDRREHQGMSRPFAEPEPPHIQEMP